jgi:hypothetical protein
MSLKVIHEFIVLGDLGLPRLSGYLFNPLLSLLENTSFLQCQKSALVLYDCLILLSQRCQYLIVTSNAFSNVVELFTKDINLFFSRGPEVPISDPRKSNQDPAADHIHQNFFVESFQTKCKIIENILIFAGHQEEIIVPAVRRKIEEAILKGLLCLVRGMRLPKISKLKFNSTELLRRSPELQLHLLHVAFAEISSPHGNSMSCIVPCLKFVCQACLLNPLTNKICAQILLFIDAIIHPSTIFLPSKTGIFETYSMSNYLTTSMSNYMRPNVLVEANVLSEVTVETEDKRESVSFKRKADSIFDLRLSSRLKTTTSSEVSLNLFDPELPDINIG